MTGEKEMERKKIEAEEMERKGIEVGDRVMILSPDMKDVVGEGKYLMEEDTQ